MGKKTPLYEEHLKANAKIVDFAGWDMPLHYGSQLNEHKTVREKVGVFDVSHMGIVDLEGLGVKPFLRELLANNIDRLYDGKALYSCMLNQGGGVIDDLIVYKIANHFFRLIINAGRRDTDLAWIKEKSAAEQINLKLRSDLSLIALQGPFALSTLQFVLPAYKEQLEHLKTFHFLIAHNESFGEIFIARTGYTGEDGFELMVVNEKIALLWNKLLSLHASPCGLGARDTLRLEAGLNLYGADMDETTTPLESNLSWTVAFEPKERGFIGRKSLEDQLQTGVRQKLVGLILKNGGIMRNHQKVFKDGHFIGEITSGGYSPTLNKSIALARIPIDFNDGCSVEIRNKQVSAQIIKPPFIAKRKLQH